LPFRCRGSRRESAVAQLSTLGIIITHIDMKTANYKRRQAILCVIALLTACCCRADEKISQIQTSLGNTTLSGYVDTSATVAYAPLFLYTNGFGKIYIFQDGRQIQDGQMLEVGSKFTLIAIPGEGYKFKNWNPVNVNIFVLSYLDSSGNTNTITTIAPQIQPQTIGGFILKSEVQPEVVINDTPEISLTGDVGWQANFEPVYRNDCPKECQHKEEHK
jgi:hypothetical protein